MLLNYLNSCSLEKRKYDCIEKRQLKFINMRYYILFFAIWCVIGRNYSSSQVIFPAFQGSHYVHQSQCGDSVTFIYNGTEVSYGIVESNGRCWLDRNLGALQVATSSTDAAAYGDLFQWGRGIDGHQTRTSEITNTLSSIDDPGHGDFIVATDFPYDWRDPQNNSLWQGVNGVNNPCPQGFRIPTEVEFNAERATWSPQNADGAFGSPLKLPKAGNRFGGNGFLENVDSNGFYWTGAVDGGTYSLFLYIGIIDVLISNNDRAAGFSVRCIKDCPYPEQPTQGSHIPDHNQIQWGWNTSTGADGYKYNTVNDFATATDNGTSTSYTQESLNCETSYSLWVWAYNECGASDVLVLNASTAACPFSCGSSFTDPRDGNVYSTVQIVSRCWMAENLKATTYNDNAPITNMADVADCETYTQGSCSWYENDPVTYADYGVYYTWYAVETGKLCPNGWHAPSQTEFNNLVNDLGGTTLAGGALKETGTVHWNEPNIGATNTSGFTARGGGQYSCPTGFGALGVHAVFWSSTDAATSPPEQPSAYFLGIPSEDTYVVLFPINKTDGYNVRCIKD